MYSEIFNKHLTIGLNIIGAYPGVRRIWVVILILAWATFLLFFAFWDLTVVYKDLEAFSDNFISTTGTITVLGKLVCLRLKRSSLTLVIKDMMKDLSNKPVPEDMAKNNLRSKSICKFLIIMNNSMYFTFVFKTILSYIFDPIEKRKYLAAVTFPFDGRQSPFYELICVSQMILAFTCFNVNSMIESFLTFSVLHAASKAKVVRQEILKFSTICLSNQNSNSNYELNSAAMKQFYQVHINFLEFTTNLQDTFSNVSFFNSFFLTIIQTFSGYMLLDAIERSENSVNILHYATLTVSFLISTGYYCIAGEYLTNESQMIFYEFCNCPWYEFPLAEKKLMIFMLMKSRKLPYLTVAKFDHLSLIHYTKVIKTSFSYLSLVRAVR